MDRRVAIFIVLASALAGAWLVWFSIPQRRSAEGKHFVPTPEPTLTVENSQLGNQTNAPTGSYSQLHPANPGEYDPTLPQWQEWRRRNKEDRQWEWKTPIVFYGHVLDQNDNPVPGAQVTLSWTDLSQAGTSVREVRTDVQGGFVLDNVRGKHLLVRSIEKAGYQDSAQNSRRFEYAAFFDSTYHIPDPNNPVIFRMHKKGAAEQLVARSGNIKIPANGPVKLNLLTGRLDESNPHLIIELVNNTDRTGRSWLARMRVPNGGIQQTTDEFATLAPESGYQPEVTIDQSSVQQGGQSGNLYKGGRFYLQTPSGYALVDLRMVPGNKAMRFSSYLNSNSNSRNLEYEPTSGTSP